MTRAQRPEESDDQVCPPADGGVPDCHTGPAGRLRFVITELAALWRDRRRRRGGADPTPRPDPTGW
ncbi:hypothetical protein [Mycolicibacterium hodleri]|uniref:Uncharacterized protein n=1 Tax=Mycolicibacterium hodleri TaxID=49897 RepID=A0A502DRY6_9MYCO|nr:hypothetical protein [Mycolicibacterium hodleri]TPG28133.1 hypothetical protein EAH80_27765 [Mycolicibacterium hodleri]